MSTVVSDILIVGAGLSGLLAANQLAITGRTITLIDKGDRVGGRLGTRQVGPGLADHGAQFFTVRTAEFQQWVDRWLATGLIFPWSTGWGDGSLATTPNDGHPRYAVRGGMNALPQQLAHDLHQQGVTIHTGIHATALRRHAAGWLIETAAQASYTAGTVVLTAPVPQSLALLDAGQVALIGKERAALAALHYDPCLCALLWIDGDLFLPEPGALQRPTAPISWIADNRRKGLSPAATIVTLHANGEFSRQHFAQPDDAVSLAFVEALLPLLGQNTRIRQTQIKRWRYSVPTSVYPERYLHAADLPPLYFAGDAFGGPRIEGAALSGLAVGAMLAK